MKSVSKAVYFEAVQALSYKIHRVYQNVVLTKIGLLDIYMILARHFSEQQNVCEFGIGDLKCLFKYKPGCWERNYSELIGTCRENSV